MISIDNKNYVCSFVACLCAVIEEGLNTSVICGIETDTLFERINGETISNHSTPKQHAFSLKYLPVAIKNGKLGSPVILSLLDSFENILGSLQWYRRDEPQKPKFMRGHANAQIIGPRGIEKRSEIVVGVTLMSPWTQYPYHHHPPEELYVVLSDGDWIQEASNWFTPGVGGIVGNPSNMGHSMRSKSAPLLTIWCLWE